ncbi:diguanylate cyclase (GGDEF)-like protein [Mycolicibacterium sp. BK556]|uniref:GGDEF domain-containing protein n=1 Tax=Mycobacteriaceae TaxID=1762 RepID=UPI00105F9823|nr:sensor domain-containing diguanylate cyclase [Mycobacterium sp. BK086]MBB3605316.1 diguanylate cyclase (GGDEF)-like protein [Mycolicibacterium sp. BK556]MBB3635512.1 diguanylate cyclase (GGDEF)-like protein [Mycolicibacterium sp. BK607]MBB3747694.1 diguanylate cyclase (GGDEF)-like protein [Mycolicibacterium sp. BK634]TDO08169.1 diguanylate cyclase (GGDEF)-like protein [Mycobacterium sp. BK086]
MGGELSVASLQTIIKVQQAINDADDTADAVMKIVVEQGRIATRAPGAVIELAEFGEMVYTTTSGSLAGTEGLRLAMSGSMSGECVRTGKILISEDTETDPRVDLEACRRVHARSMVVVPLVDGNRTQGVLKVTSDQPSAFTDDDVDLLEQLAQFIAKALARANVMDEKAHAASVDALTGLANRAAFLAGLESMISGAAGTGNPVAVVLYIDLDGFKPINDVHGHAVGDEVLRIVGQRIAATCRGEDMGARIGGDEFAVLLSSSFAPDPFSLRERLLTVLQKEIPTSAGVVSVGASCGTAVVGGADLAEAVLARADAAMYADKRTRSTARS